ncbi:MAG: MerR family transcriptional regulator [Nitrospinae bacterium]|nr:MerR family transcriptional regulator [Nitrospinota bacterium]
MAQTARNQQIPDKLFFKIGEVAELTGTKPHVLRYWESEFRMLRPAKGDSGQRVYRRKDVELVFSIKQLLYEENFTIAGAKKQLQKQRAARAEANKAKKPVEANPEIAPMLPFEKSKRENIDLTWIRKELRGILGIIDRAP